MIISHSADIQIKSRNINLYKESLATLKTIEELVEKAKSKIHIISGDLFEFAEPNDIERNLVYNHIINLLKVKTLEELYIIDGNHDLVKEKKKTTDTNAISVIANILKTINNEYTNKIRYCKNAEIIESSIDNNLIFVPYPLEKRNEWEELTKTVDTSYHDKTKICLYHAMLKEYAESEKLPVNTSKLDSIDIFPKNSKIFAGDIHQPFIFKSENNQTFIYPGATMQHTFGEGHYINVSDDVKFKLAPKKKFNIYQIDTINQSIKQADAVIPEFIQYITIRLDSNIPYDLIKYNLENLDITNINEEKNISRYIRIKTANIFISKEQEIFNIIKNKFTNSHIQFEYDKFVQKDESSNNKIIQELIDNKIEEISTDSNETELLISSSNIDNLVLTNEQCIKLFDNILKNSIEKLSDSFDSDITSDNIYSDIIALFNNQLELCTNKSSQRFNIKFESVECNNFMILGHNIIDLTEKGITRILGTNGIGKTTLYRLIRWIITGHIMEGMKANQVVQNNLLVFNKNLPDNNFVEGILNLNINGQKIQLKRIVTREWKKDITDEQKLSQNWQDFVSKTNRDFELVIYPIDETKAPKKFIGEQAEKTIINWFGDTVNNLLFLNQEKIRQILNTSPTKLNEDILNYIGIDYLEKLEANLDGVKEDLMSIHKPNISKEELHEKILDSDIKIRKAKEESKNIEKEKLTLNDIIDSESEKLELINKELINIGNIPEQQNNLNQDLELIKSNIKNLESEPNQYKEKPEFNENKPTLNQEEIDKQKQLILEKEEKIKEFENKCGEVSNKILELQNNKFQLINHEIKNNLFEIKINSDKVLELNKDIKDNFETIREDLQITVDKLNLKYNEKLDAKHKLLSSNEQLEKDENHYKEELKNGYCPTCKREYDNFTQEDKNRIMMNIKNVLEIKEQNIQQLEQLNIWFEQFKNIKSKIDNDYKLAINQDLKIFKDAKLLLKYNKQYCCIKSNKEEINNINDKLNQYNKNVEYLNKHDFDANDLILSENFKNNYWQFVNDIDSYNIKIEEYKLKINSLKSEISSYQNIIDSINNQYQKDFNTYQNLYNQWQKDCEEIDKYNQNIQEIKNKIVIYNEKLLNLQQDLNLLEQKLPEYNKLNNQYIEVNSIIKENKNKLQEINDTFTKQQVTITSYQNEKEKLQEKYDDLIKYQKNQIIWKIYSKLIKINFKQAVFEYYRVFLNNTLNHLLSDVSFKLYWNRNSELTMVNCKNGLVTYQPVQLSSGMETTFLGLSLIYCIGLLNVKNTVSHLFIDEISGTLNKGKELSYAAENYQELFVKILSKFKDKSILIVDHNIDDIKENIIYEVIPEGKSSKYVRK